MAVERTPARKSSSASATEHSIDNQASNTEQRASEEDSTIQQSASNNVAHGSDLGINDETIFVQPSAPPVVNQPTGTLPKKGRKPKRVAYPDEPRNTRSNAQANKDAGTDNFSRASSSNSIAFTLGPDDLTLLHGDGEHDDDPRAHRSK
ncbi:hypothetical protein QAD02_020819 [Eretmocerus hayati]|uniref:Uncharacterized protein n=1 Tax=Eretmocerus hayati TaxID=131215 RepID=A0ACC2PNF2_9HYME|nr:hypothetical protein QAD02_020819 [Eretmocerus hayati]